MVEGREKVAYLLALLDLGSALSASLLLALALLEKSLRHVDGVLGRDGAVATVELVRSSQVAMYRENAFAPLEYRGERRLENCRSNATFSAVANSMMIDLIGEILPREKPCEGNAKLGPKGDTHPTTPQDNEARVLVHA